MPGCDCGSASSIVYLDGVTAVSEFDHVRWSGNTLVAIDSAGGSPVLVRNSEGGLVAADLQNANLLDCADAGLYCQPEDCSNEDVGISCWCVATASRSTQKTAHARTVRR